MSGMALIIYRGCAKCKRVYIIPAMTNWERALVPVTGLIAAIAIILLSVQMRGIDGRLDRLERPAAVALPLVVSPFVAGASAGIALGS